MKDNRLGDYLDHMMQAASDACSFVEGVCQVDFLDDKRTQQAVIMSLIIIGEAASKVMDNNEQFTQHTLRCRGVVCGACVIESHRVISISTSMLFGLRCKQRYLSY